jgi:hypothetical protein
MKIYFATHYTLEILINNKTIKECLETLSPGNPTGNMIYKKYPNRKIKIQNILTFYRMLEYCLVLDLRNLYNFCKDGKI